MFTIYSKHTVVLPMPNHHVAHIPRNISFCVTWKSTLFKTSLCQYNLCWLIITKHYDTLFPYQISYVLLSVYQINPHSHTVGYLLVLPRSVFELPGRTGDSPHRGCGLRRRRRYEFSVCINQQSAEDLLWWNDFLLPATLLNRFYY